MRKKLHTRTIAVLLLFAFLVCLTGCGQTAPDKLTITLEGSEIGTLELVNGSEQAGIRAEISPSDYAGEISWTCEDSGIAKIVSSVGSECVLSARKVGSTKLTAECNGVSVSVRVHVLEEPVPVPEVEPALTVNGVVYSAEQLALYYAEQYYGFLAQYGSYATYYGLDPSGGIQTLAEQGCDSSSDGTWRGYFLDGAVSMISTQQALCDYAAENGIELTEEDEPKIQQQMDALEASVAEFGYSDVDDFLTDFYGAGITTEMYLEGLRQSVLAEKAYDFYGKELEYSTEEINAYYQTLGYSEGENDYRVTAMRHILIMAEPDENGECSEEAIAAAHKKAETIYAEWTGSEPTEEHFAELANRYSEDSGSNTTGGIYTNIYQGKMVEGIDSWLFGEVRVTGDTAIIDNDGSYTGTHIVYFLGYGEMFSTLLGMSGLIEQSYQEWLQDLSVTYSAEPGPAYETVGIFGNA